MNIYRVVLKEYFDSEDVVKVGDHVVVIFNDPEREYYEDAGVRTLDGQYIGQISHGSDEGSCSPLHNLHYAEITEITQRTYTIKMNLGEVIKLEYYPKIAALEGFKKAFELVQTLFPKAVELFQLQDLKRPDHFRFSNMLHIIEKIDEYYSLQYLDNNYARPLNLVRVYLTTPTYFYLKSQDSHDFYTENIESCLGGWGNPRYKAHKKFMETHNDYNYNVEIERTDLLTLR